MTDSWRRWVHEVISAQQDDTFVTLLKQRLAAGESVMRVGIESGDLTVLPVYRLVLRRGSSLSELRLPHSFAFTRWSFETGTCMESPEQEAWRFDALLSEKFGAMVSELGKDYFRSLLYEEIRRLAPPRTSALITSEHFNPAQESNAKYKSRLRLHEVLGNLIERLVRDLRYEEAAAADILDGALARSVDKTFGLGELSGLRSLWES